MRARPFPFAFLALSLACLAGSNDPALARNFTPVQEGFQPAGKEVPAFMADRVLVKFRESAIGASRIPPGLDYRGEVPGLATGLSRVDAAIRAARGKALRQAYIRPANAARARELGVDRWFVLETDGTRPADVVAAEFAALPEVETASVDWIAFPAVVPADPLHAMHWGHNNTSQLLSYNWANNNHETGSPVGTAGFDCNAQAAWDGTQGYGSSSVIIAIIDSGVAAGHPDLTQVTGYDYGSNDSNPDDNSSQAGHGTACAGVAAARANSLGSAGAAPGCSIMPLKVANNAGTMSFTSIQNALYYAADHGASIISMSLGAAITSDPATDTAINYAWNAGCVILAATGNENSSTISYPANHANVIGVGAASPCGDRKRSSSSSGEVNPGVSTDPNGYTCDGERWWGSNYGSTTQNAAGAVDVIAPTILPTTDRLGSAGYDPSDYSKWFNGTSCATPYAAGVCGLIRSKNPSWTNAQVRDQIKNTAIDATSIESAAGWDRYTGFGMVDAQAAVGGGAGGDVVTVTAPNGGESLTAGVATTITWTWSGSFTTVNIDYSTNGGSSWTSIVTATANDGSHSWTVPSAATTQGRVRVSGGTATDMSNANFTITVPGGGYATLPYATGFETGALDSYWTTAVTGDGRVRVLNTNTPHGGSWHLVMDDATSGTYNQTEARLKLNLSGVTQANMTFWWKDLGDETHTQDGIYFSNNGGTSYTKVYSLNGASYSDNTWRSFTLDVDALAASAGLSLTSTFVVKFQQYDDYPVTTDGFAFDDISVTVPTGGGGITAESESNNTSGTADGPVGTGLGVTGAISSSTDVDYFYFDVTSAGNVNISLSIGSSADLDWFLYNSALTEVARGYTTANPEAGSYSAAAGRYYLMVDGYQTATSSYTLTITGGLANSIQPIGAAEKPWPLAPIVAALHQNVPNPFHSSTAIRFALPAPGRVSLQVFDVSGRLVSTLADGILEAGEHSIDWSGRNQYGEEMPIGVYFYRLTAPDFVETKKMLYTR
ncbi:MAG TPA: S8 family serine peptidase [Candidatus Eisenbacteria bacterium]